MDELDLETENYSPPKILSGWSPDVEEIELPTKYFRPLTEAEQEKANIELPFINIPYDNQVLEFKIYYANRRKNERRVLLNRTVSQNNAVIKSLNAGINLVLATQDFTVYRASNIWKLIWIYFKYKIISNWKTWKNRRSRPKLPSYY